MWEGPKVRRGSLLAVLAITGSILLALGPSIASGAPLPLNYLRYFPPFPGGEHGHPNWHPLWFDGVGQFLAWRVTAGRALAEGVFPLWNPFSFCGQPFLANGQSALLYPPTWLFLLLGPLWGFSVNVALHLLGAAFGVFLWLRRRGVSDVASSMAGISYALSAPLVLRVPVLSHLSAASLLPWCLLGVDKAVGGRGLLAVVALGVVMALPVLAGHFQMASFVWLAILIYGAFRARKRGGLVRLALGLTLAVVFSLPQVLPTLDLSKVSHRRVAPSPEGWEFYRRTALHPAMLVTLFVPDAFGEPFQGDFLGPSDYVEGVGYAGVVALPLFLLALLHRRGGKGFLALIGAFSVLVALATPVAFPLYALMPSSATPSRILFLWAFSFSCLSALGLDELLGGRASSGEKVGVALGALGIFGLLSATALALWGEGLRMALTIGGGRGWITALGLALIGAGGVALFRRRAILYALVALQVLDLVAFGATKIPRGSRADFKDALGALRSLREVVPEGRVCGVIERWPLRGRPYASLPPNLSSLGGLFDLSGYDSLHLMAYRQLLGALLGAEPSPPENGNICSPVAPSLEALERALKVLGAEAVVLPTGEILKLSRSRPLAFVPRKVVRFKGWAEASKYLGSLKFDPLVEVTTVGEGVKGGKGRVLRWEVKWDGLGAEVEVEKTSFVLLLIPAAPGMMVWVDGRRAVPRVADLALIGATVPRGRHTVEAVYHPSSFSVGLFVALLAVGACVALGCERKVCEG